ncbi:MAG: hypothetical protein GX119_06885 [Syntrophomonadaceae bacterium]|nr:hypothetical protein [Syntrophomonadaceae bacterium]
MDAPDLRSKAKLPVVIIYLFFLAILSFLLILMVIKEKPVNQDLVYSLELVEDSSTADAIIYTWQVVIEEPVRTKDLRYLAEKMIHEAQAGPSFNGLEILIYDYPEYIGYGYTIARIIFAPQGNISQANTVKAGDYKQMSIQWDLRQKIWEKRLGREQVLVWKAWQDYYREESRGGKIADKSSIDEIVADKYGLEPTQVYDIRLKQEYWRYANFDYLTR